MSSGLPRPIAFRTEKRSDAVIFTDGLMPDIRFHEKGEDRIGAVIFDVRDQAPFQFTAMIPQEVKNR